MTEETPRALKATRKDFQLDSTKCCTVLYVFRAEWDVWSQEDLIGHVGMMGTCSCAQLSIVRTRSGRVLPPHDWQKSDQGEQRFSDYATKL